MVFSILDIFILSTLYVFAICFLAMICIDAIGETVNSIKEKDILFSVLGISVSVLCVIGSIVFGYSELVFLISVIQNNI